MGEAEILSIMREFFWAAALMSLPLLGTALLVGLAVGLLQALTSIQEMTLTFVPKIIIIFISIVVFLPFMMNQVIEFGRSLFDRISALG